MKRIVFFCWLWPLLSLLGGQNMLAQTVSVGPVALQAGETAAISLNLSDAARFNAAGMYIVLPEGFSFVALEKGAAANAADTLAWREQEPAVVRFLLVDMQDNAAFAADGPLLTAVIRCDSTVEAGEYAAEIRTIELSRMASRPELVVLPDTSFAITVSEIPLTGVGTPGYGRNGVAEIYNTAGERLPAAPAHGVFIYKYADGRVRKVAVK